MLFYCFTKSFLIVYQILIVPIKTKFDFNKFEWYPSHVIQLVGKVTSVDLANTFKFHPLGWFSNLLVFFQPISRHENNIRPLLLVYLHNLCLTSIFSVTRNLQVKQTIGWRIWSSHKYCQTRLKSCQEHWSLFCCCVIDQEKKVW